MVRRTGQFCTLCGQDTFVLCEQDNSEKAMAELKSWLAERPAVRASVDDLVLSLKRRCGCPVCLPTNRGW